MFGSSLVASLFVLIKGADYFIEGASTIGKKIGMSPFVIGVLIVGFGTSLPEFASSIAGVLNGATEIVIANVVGSNIANILLIVGVLALFSTRIDIRRDLLKSELPLFVIATTHFVFAVMDGKITQVEALLLLGTLCAYIWYIVKEPSDEAEENKNEAEPAHSRFKIALYTIGGLGAVVIGAHYTVFSAIELATLMKIPIGIVSILGIAVGTSLPELVVSLQAIKTGSADLAIGNIFGSNAVNMLLVAGLPALITTLYADEIVMGLGLHVLIASSVIFVIHGLSRRLMRWEGMMLVLFFAFFVVQLFAFIA